MNNLVAQQQGYSFPMDEISRTYYPGRGFLTDQEAYPMDMYGNVKVPEIPKDIFNRPPRYSGGLNIPGAPGNVAEMPRYIRGKFAPSGAIIKAPHLDSPYMDEQIRRGFVPMTPPPSRPPGPQLFPLAQQLPMGFQNKYVS
tara:strand:- start:215 stop:637 length:423 start_codon:yes stop_codon:yes gene_type:complete